MSRHITEARSSTSMKYAPDGEENDGHQYSYCKESPTNQGEEPPSHPTGLIGQCPDRTYGRGDQDYYGGRQGGQGRDTETRLGQSHAELPFPL